MEKLYVAMMGLPARGKSTLARRIASGLEQQGIRAGIFNNGNTRRKVYGNASASADFFNPFDEAAVSRRMEIARTTMDEARRFLSSKGDVAIIDATHGTLGQRRRLLEYLNDCPVLFIECVNGRQDLIDIFLTEKIALPEFAGMSKAMARAEFQRRIAFYESVYTPLRDEASCWMRVDAADCVILEERPSPACPHYPAIRNIVLSRWVNNLYLVRHGATVSNGEGRIGGDGPLSEEGMRQAEHLARSFRGVSVPYVFTSTRLRTVQTAAPLLQTRPIGTAHALEEFDEIDAGACEGMTYREVKEAMPDEYAARSANKYAYVYPGGESYAMLRERVAKGLTKALFVAKEDALMIIGHQAVNRAILSLFLAHRPGDIPYLNIPQNQFYHITITHTKKMVELIRFV